MIVHCDGLCQPMNPGGIATYGFVARRDGRLVHEEHGLAAEPFHPDASGNLGEYTALLKALRWLVEHHPGTPATIRGDSQLVIHQVLGKWQTKDEVLIPLQKEAARLLAEIPDAVLEWVPRAENLEADALSYNAYVEIVESDPELLDRVKPHLATPAQRRLLERAGCEILPYMSWMEARRTLDKLAKAEARAQAEAEAASE